MSSTQQWSDHVSSDIIDNVMVVHLDDGKANAAVCRVVAKFLGVPKTAVAVVRGATSRHKTLTVAGLERVEIDRIVSERLPDDA